MPLSKEDKDKIIKKYRTHESDTGSSEVQIAILTAEIAQLTEHLKQHKHDNSSRVGLVRKVQERRRLLKYLQRENEKSYEKLTKDLKLKTLELEKEEAEKVAKEEKEAEKAKE